LGDIVLSYQTIKKEAEEQNKILKAKTVSFKKELDNLREQILMGKRVFIRLLRMIS
jgi:hypothetical protein